MTDQYELFQEKTKIVKGSSRDLMVHIAATIMPTKKGVLVVGEKCNEIGQFAVEVEATNVPMNEKQAKAMLEALSYKCFERMRAAGLIR